MSRDIELLLKTAEWVRREHGHHYDQATFGFPIGFPAGTDVFKIGEEIPPCRTTGCVAGNAMLATGRYVLVKNNTWDFRFLNKVTGQIVDNPSDEARDLLGLDEVEASILFNENWRPAYGTVSEALEALARGDSIYDVTDPDCDDDD